MLTVEAYGRIRIAHRDGLSLRQIARRYGHSRRKIRQVLDESEPRPYTLPLSKACHTHLSIWRLLAPINEKRKAMKGLPCDQRRRGLGLGVELREKYPQGLTQPVCS